MCKIYCTHRNNQTVLPYLNMNQLWTEWAQQQHIRQLRSGLVKSTREHQRRTNRASGGELGLITSGKWCLFLCDVYTPGPWCPVHSEVSGWRCQSSAAGAAERRLWAGRRPPCRKSLTETRRGMKIEERTHTWGQTCTCRDPNGPTALVGSESSFRFSSHSWSCFFTLFMRDSCNKKLLYEMFLRQNAEHCCTLRAAVLTES